ncbi:MAG: preprotein translocase subunit SecG [Candidatus Acidiferrales bacterium]|jgi:preprotein translocase subunit SecG
MPSWAKWGISLAIGFGLIWIGWKFTAMLVTMHVVICLILIVVIMLQSGSAADLAGAFGGAGSQTAFGPRGAATFLSRATTWCAIMFMLSSLALSVKRAPTGQDTTGSILEQTQKSAPAPAATKPPVQFPAQAPVPGNGSPSQAPPANQTPPPKK